MSRRLILFLGLILFAGLCGYILTRHFLRTPSIEEKGHQRWLCREFNLSSAQSARIEALQTSYAPVCAGHCRAIARAKTAFDAAIDATARTAAQAELDRLKIVCTEATRVHLQAVAACMAPDQGARFLALMEPHVAHEENQTGAPSLEHRP